MESIVWSTSYRNVYNNPRLPKSLPVRAPVCRAGTGRRTQTGNGGHVCDLCPDWSGLSIKILSELGIIITMMLTMILFACNSMKVSETVRSWESLIKMHLMHYPDMQADDIYKMVYQGVLGPGHLGNDFQKILNYLNREMSQIEAISQMKLIENIAPDSSYIRINLKRFKYDGLSSDKLAAIITKSARNSPKNPEHFREIWIGITKRVKNGQLSVNQGAFSKFNQYVIENNYPVIHHSKDYIEKYFPSYRVVSRKVWESEKWSDKKSP